MHLVQIAQALALAPELGAVSYHQLITFIDLIRILKPILSRLRPAYYVDLPPESIPVNIHDFLLLCLDVSDECLEHLWATFKDLAWSDERLSEGNREQGSLGGGKYTERRSIDAECSWRLFVKDDSETAKGVGFFVGRGVSTISMSTKLKSY